MLNMSILVYVDAKFYIFGHIWETSTQEDSSASYALVKQI